MKAPSFHDILTELLEEEAPTPSPHTIEMPLSFEPTPLLQWSRPPLKSVNGKGYPKTERPVEKPKPEVKVTPDPPPEIVISLSHLSAAHRVLAERMIQWGGSELAEGLCFSSLKKAHRRLVKRLHPDLGAARAQANHELFLQVQAAYETLRKALPRYISGSAGGSESASAEESRRPNAA